MTDFTTSQRRILASGGAAIALLAATAFTLESRVFVWNATASVPRGLYARVPGTFARGDFALAWLPGDIRALADARRYLSSRVPALKPVAALAGDTVCAAAESISINGAAVAKRAASDHLGRPMPHWEGCRTLGDGQVFLLSTYAGDSFDGRFFGPSNAADIIEKVAPVWTFP